MAGLTEIELLGLDATAIAEGLESFSAEQLSTLIRRGNREYWREQRPSMPDPLYDLLVEQLRSLQPDAPVLEDLGEPAPSPRPASTEDRVTESPTARFGAPVKHQRAMRSLEKCYDDEALHKWSSEFEGEVLAMPKMDGVALSLHYDARGALMVGATRGDGRVGEDVTKNILRINDIPHQVADSGAAIEVRGEVYMRLSTFEQFAEEYANPRNLTAGTLKQKDGDPERCALLSFFAYDLIGPTLLDERAKFERLLALGFRHEGHAIEFVEAGQLAENFAAFGERRASLDYEIDGVVYRASLQREQARLGETAHHPKWAIAYKFQGESGQTVLDDVVWSVSRTGTITPVALLTPITLSGASIGRASLHNLSRFNELILSRDCSVEVTRRGGVIPMVERVVKQVDGAAPFTVPTSCPACGGDVVVRSEREAEFLMCALPSQCQQARISSLEHFAKVTDIQGFGPKVIEQCVERALLGEPADFFTLKHEQLRTLERLGDKSAHNLVEAIAAREQLDLPTFLQALGINHLGRQYAELLAERFLQLDAVLTASRDSLISLHGVSDLVADALLAGFQACSATIENLRRHVQIKAYEPPPDGPPADPSHPLAGKSVLFTGTLTECDRKTAQVKVTGVGGVAARAVNSTLDFLVVGAGRGAKSSKQKKAEALIEKGASIQIIGELDFLAMVDAPPPP